MWDDGPTALVFAGGGSHGAVQVGMLREIVSAGARFDFVVGASAGAINAAYFARAPSLQTVERLETLWKAIRRSDIMPVTFRSLWNLVTHADAVFDGARLRTLLESCLTGYAFSDAATRLFIVATELLSGHEVVLSSGSVVDALMASTAIPGVFPSMHIDGHELVDGGVANNTPISTAVRLGARRVVVLATGYACALKPRPRGVTSHAMNALNHLVARQLAIDIERYADQVEIIVVPSLCPLEVSSYDYSRCDLLIERAAGQTRQWLREDGPLRRETASANHIHLHEHRYRGGQVSPVAPIGLA